MDSSEQNDKEQKDSEAAEVEQDTKAEEQAAPEEEKEQPEEEEEQPEEAAQEQAPPASDQGSDEEDAAEERAREALAKYSFVCMILMALGLYLLLPIFKIRGADIGLSIKVGQHICQTRTIPRQKLFAFTTSPDEAPIPRLGWLSDVAFHKVASAGGIALVSWTKVLIVAFAFVLLMLVARKNDNNTCAAICATALALAIARPSLTVGGETFSLLFFVLFLVFLDLFRRGSPAWLVVFPVLGCVWANLHAGMLLGLVLMLAFLVGEVLRRALGTATREGQAPPLTPAKVTGLLIATVATAAAAIVNPFGVAILVDPLRHGPGAFFHPVIQGLPEVTNFLFFAIVAAVTIVMAVVTIARQNLTTLVVFAVFAVVSLCWLGDFALFAITAAPVLSSAIAAVANRVLSLWERLGTDSQLLLQEKRARLNGLICVLLVLVYCVAKLSPGNLEFGTAFDSRVLPVKACDFIERENLGGRIFNAAGFGSYLVWRSWPEREVYAHARNRAYREPFWEKDYRPVINGDPTWRAVLDRQQIDVIVTDYPCERFDGRRAERERPHLANVLADAAGWKLVFWDDRAAVYVREDPEDPVTQRLIEMYSIPQVNPMKLHPPKDLDDAELYQLILGAVQTAKSDPDCMRAQYLAGNCLSMLAEKEYQLGTRLAMLGSRIASDDFFRRALKLHNDARNYYLNILEVCTSLDIWLGRPEANYGLGRSFYASQFLDRRSLSQAVEHLRTVIRLDDEFEGAHAELGLCYFGMDRPHEAAGQFEKELALDSKNMLATGHLALCRANQGRLAEAEKLFKAALQLDAGSVFARSNLAVVYGIQNKIPEAIAELAAALRLDPDNSDAQERMRVIIENCTSYIAGLLSKYCESQAKMGSIKALLGKPATGFSFAGGSIHVLVGPFPSADEEQKTAEELAAVLDAASDEPWKVALAPEGLPFPVKFSIRPPARAAAPEPKAEPAE